MTHSYSQCHPKKYSKVLIFSTMIKSFGVWKPVIKHPWWFVGRYWFCALPSGLFVSGSRRCICWWTILLMKASADLPTHIPYNIPNVRICSTCACASSLSVTILPVFAWFTHTVRMKGYLLYTSCLVSPSPKLIATQDSFSARFVPPNITFHGLRNHARSLES